MPTRSRGGASGPAALVLAGSVLAVAACSGPGGEPGAADERVPLGAVGYRLVLAEQTGSAVDPAAVARAAGEVGERTARRMDELAGELGHDGWRAAFAALRLERPAGAAVALAAYRQELERAAAFATAHDLVGLPPEQPAVVPLESPALRDHFPLGLYREGTFAVTLEAGASAGPAGADYLANHCAVCIPPLAVHEGYPGHHVAFWHWSRHGAPPARELVRYRTLVEGWGLYAEWLMLERGYYDEPGRELGAWRMILLRALRAAVDVDLHGGGLDPGAAAELYRRELLMTAEAAEAEVRIHLDKPGAKASYFVGLLQLLALRRAVLGDEPGPGLREFHDRLLEELGPVPEIARRRFGVEIGEVGEGEPVAPEPVGLGG